MKADEAPRKRYLKAVAAQHRLIRFSGMGPAPGDTEVERGRVFVMPQVIAQDRMATALKEELKKPLPAHAVLTGSGASRCAMILGGPGTGKTTLLESFAFALAASPAPFPWAKKLPRWLPVYCRVRDLDPWLDRHPGKTLWSFFEQQAAAWTASSLPAGFFHRANDTAGLLLLVDALDEAASPDRRSRVVDRVSAFAEALAARSRVLVTGRPYDYLHRFDPAHYGHFEVCPFDDEQIQEFLRCWSLVHQPDAARANERAAHLWSQIHGNERIQPLARIPLLVTMIAKVHFGAGVLPENRLELYQSCAKMLLHYWAEAKGLPPSPLQPSHKAKFLSELAYLMQRGEAGEQAARQQESALVIRRPDLATRLEHFLREKAQPLDRVDAIIDRLHKVDAILTNYGQDQFGFVHRSFQEYFAANWMAEELEPEEFRALVKGQLPGWAESLALAVAQWKDRSRRRLLADLLKQRQIEFAYACLRTSKPEEEWLDRLVRFLSRCYPGGAPYPSISAAPCADAVLARAGALQETIDIINALFVKETRDGRALCSALELAEELMRRGVAELAPAVTGFLAEAGESPLEREMVPVGGFLIDKYLVTNQDYECMAPAHRTLRDRYSHEDKQPVIYVNWYEARLFCRWRGEGFRLPAEEEWYKAAAWDRKQKKYRTYPWGDKFDPKRCNTSEGGPGRTTAVDAYPGGASDYGCFDMAGNVWEWTDSLFTKDEDWRVFRGGSWGSLQDLAACACRGCAHPALCYDLVGFRCARTS